MLLTLTMITMIMGVTDHNQSFTLACFSAYISNILWLESSTDTNYKTFVALVSVSL